MKTPELARSIWLRRRVIGIMGALLGSVIVLTGAQQSSGPDFALSVSPASAAVQPGASQRYILTVTGEHGFAGTVNAGISGVSPRVANGPLFSLSRYDIWVSGTAPTGKAWITASTSTSTPAGTYTLTVTGKDIMGGSQYGLTHSTTFALTVQ